LKYTDTHAGTGIHTQIAGHHFHQAYCLFQAYLVRKTGSNLIRQVTLCVKTNRQSATASSWLHTQAGRRDLPSCLAQPGLSRCRGRAGGRVVSTPPAADLSPFASPHLPTSQHIPMQPPVSHGERRGPVTAQQAITKSCSHYLG